MTVSGPIDTEAMGITLPHEHILVDFIGAKDYSSARWNQEDVVRKVLSYLGEAKEAGCRTIIDCTPNYLGRDAALLLRCAESSGLNIITNTGYYGGSNHKFLPDHAFTETAMALAERWIDEWKNGIDSTPVRPGFIKISVNPESLSDISKKLVQAAAITHLQTGLTIASHTGPAIAAMDEIELLKQEGVHPRAFVWVHAQNERDWNNYVTAAREGAWVSLDGLSEENFNDYADRLSFLQSEKCLDRILVSHDAGWYEPGKPDGGNFRPYTVLFKKLLPLLREKNFKEAEINQLIRRNPEQAFEISIKRWKKG